MGVCRRILMLPVGVLVLVGAGCLVVTDNGGAATDAGTDSGVTPAAGEGPDASGDDAGEEAADEAATNDADMSDAPSGATDDSNGGGDGSATTSEPEPAQTLAGTFRYIHPNGRQDVTLRHDGTCTFTMTAPDGEESVACTYSFAEGTISFDDGAKAPITYGTEDMFHSGEAPFRRVLADGSVKDYPKVLEGKWLRSGGRELTLYASGEMTIATIDSYGSVYSYGQYDLHEGFVFFDSGYWNTLFVIDDQHLRMGDEVFARYS